MAAFQITPSFLSTYAYNFNVLTINRVAEYWTNGSRTIHALITGHGAAMRTILERLELIMGEGKEAWDEVEDIKIVRYATASPEVFDA
jgi:hypothetical protein